MCDLFELSRSTRVGRKSFPRTGSFLFGTWLVLAAAPWDGGAKAQMFSADGTGSRASVSPFRSVWMGPDLVTFERWGEGENELGLSGGLIGIGFDAGGVSVRSSFSLADASPENASLFTIGASVDNSLRLAGTEEASWFLPFRISTDYLQVSRERVEAQFRQSSLRLGGGMGWGLRRGRFSLRATITPELGFSYSQGSIFGGGTRGIEAEMRVGRIPLGSKIGLEGGYRYTARRYDIDGDLYDYRLNGHRLALGVAF